MKWFWVGVCALAALVLALDSDDTQSETANAKPTDDTGNHGDFHDHDRDHLSRRGPAAKSDGSSVAKKSLAEPVPEVTPENVPENPLSDSQESKPV